MQSEAVLVGLLATTKQPAVLLIIVATVGNILGAIQLVAWRLPFKFPRKPLVSKFTIATGAGSNLVPSVRSVDTDRKLATLYWGSDNCCRRRHARTINLFSIVGKHCERLEISFLGNSCASIVLNSCEPEASSFSLSAPLDRREPAPQRRLPCHPAAQARVH